MRIQNGAYHLAISAMADFKRNKIRTLLTSLGIMIGVLSVVMLIALGLGLKNYIRDVFENLGTNLIFVMPGTGFGGGEDGGGFGSPAGMFGGIKFDERDVSSLKRIPQAEYVVPVFFKSAVVETGSEEELGYVMGVSEEFFAVMSADAYEGRVFDRSDVQARAKVAVLGYQLAEKLFKNPGDAVGKTIRVDDMRLRVNGVIEKTGDNETDTAVVIPHTTTYGGMNPDKTFWAIYLAATSKDEVEAVKDQVKEILLRRYKESDFSVMDPGEILSTVNQIFGVVNAILVAIGSISLVVGGIGIMNIMYASVTERTKEVGVRRAVGATRKDILLQFLTESVMLSLFGGLMGLLLAIGLVLVIRLFFPVAINLLAVVISFGVSSAIGVFFGVFPARRAANLPPIEAIRYE